MLVKLLKDELNIELTDKQIIQFEKYTNFLTEENKKYNLTRIENTESIYIKHYLDSLLIVKTLDFNNIKSLVDLGSGAGFPAIPLKIIYPHIKMYLVESITKKANFLGELINILELEDINILNERAETLSNYKNKFDCVTARAFSNLQVLLELSIPLLKVNGHLIAMKALNYQNELTNAANALKILKAQVEKIDKMELPNNLGVRNQIVIRKLNNVSGYPRAYSLIKKKPL